MVHADVIAHLQSLAGELDSRSNRVRQLIGAKHWLSDGHHKEHLLRGLIERYTPSGVVVAPGFVIDPRRPDRCSREQDVLIVDTMQQAPLFSEGGLVIVIPEMVIGHVSVKTTFGQGELADTLKTLASARNVAEQCGCDQDRVWSGGFFYTVDEGDARDWPKIARWFSKGLAALGDGQQPAACSLVCSCSPDLLCCLRPESAGGNTMLHVYECGHLAPAVFLAMLMDHIHELRGGTGTAFANILNDSAIKPACDPVAINVPSTVTAGALPAARQT